MSERVRWLAWLLPRSERALVLRELDELAARRDGPALGRTTWYLAQLLSFAVRLRIERLRRGSVTMGALGADITFGARQLLRRPGYLAAGVLTLGIGTGGVATVYGVAHWVLLRDVPGVGGADELVWLRLESDAADSWGTMTWGIMQPDLEEVGRRTPSVTAIEASRAHEVHLGLRLGAPASRETASLVTPGYFDVLSMQPEIGRFFEPDDHVGGEGPREVVIGYALWERGWGRSGAAVGATLEVNGWPFRVIGVAPDGFRGAELPGATELWLASSAFPVLRPTEAEVGLDGALQLWDRLLARRVEGASTSDVAAHANAAIEAIRNDKAGRMHSFTASHFVFRAYAGIGLDPGVRDEVRRTLAILLGGSLFLLVLSIANVANLGLTRAAHRRDSVAIRRALGASGWAVARGPLIEGMIVGLAGGAVGLTVLGLGSGPLGALSLAGGEATLDGMQIDRYVTALAALVAIAAGVASGIVPALAVRRETALTWLSGNRSSDRSVTRSRSLLVIGQVSLSAALLVGAGLLGRTVLNMNAIDLGVDRDAYVFSLDPMLNGYDDASTPHLMGAVRDRLWTRFGPGSAGLVFPSLMTGWRVTGSLHDPDDDPESGARGSTFWTTGNGFFGALGIDLVAGDGFEQDFGVPEGAPPIVINEAMARSAFPGRAFESIIARHVRLGREETVHTVVGVVSDARIVSPLQEAGPSIFRPWDTGWSEGTATFVVSSGLPERETLAAVGDAVQAEDLTVPIYDTFSLGGKADVLLSSTHAVARLASILGFFGLVLVSLGLYGVLAYTVTERSHELGLRAALGATAEGLRREVLGDGVRLAVVGLAAALPLSIGISRLLESRLYGLSALDPTTYALGIVVVLTVAVLASWIPANRATTVAPAEVLRGN